MATKRITFSLDSASIDRAVSELNTYIEDVQAKIGELVKALTEQGAHVAIVKVVELGAVDTGELSDSIWGFYDEESHVGFVRSSAPYAIFVEYGTGIMGADASHPEMEGEWNPPGGWVYDHNDHGDKGWKYVSNRDGKLHWTKGMPSRPFMYETFKELQTMAHDIAVKIFAA